MSPEQKAAMEKTMKEREAAMKKNEALNDAFNEGMTAMQAKQYDAAVAAFNKAAELDPKQHVVWAQLAEAYDGPGGQPRPAPSRTPTMTKGLEAYGKALELKPDDAAYHNNFALALVKAKKIPEAQAELTKAAQIDPHRRRAVLLQPGRGAHQHRAGAMRPRKPSRRPSKPTRTTPRRTTSTAST